MIFKKHVFALLFFNMFLFKTFVFPEGVLEPSLQKHEKNLGELQQKIEQLRKDQSLLKKDENDLSTQINSLESAIRQSLIKQNYYNRKALKTKAEVEELKRAVEKFQGEERTKEMELLTSLQGYHIHIAYPQRLHEDKISNYLYQDRVGYESQLLSEVKETKKNTLKVQVLKTQAQLDWEKQQMDWKTRAKESNLEKVEKRKLYSQILKKKKLTEGELKELEVHKGQLENLIAQLRRKTPAGMSQDLRRSFILSLKGELPWPVKGELYSRFGRQKHPTLNIVTINNGIRIKAIDHADVKSVEDGKVIFASEFKSYGLTIIIDHGGDFYSIYGLLSQLGVEKGKDIAKGQVIGKINTSPEPQLYFEFRNSGLPEDPLQWLR